MINQELLSAETINISNILTDVSIKLHSNEIIGIVGESGCGKTTLLKCLVGILKPHEGKVKYSGIDIQSMNISQRTEFRKSVQMVYQDAGGSLNPQIRIKEILQEPLLIHGIQDPHDQLIQSILETFSLTNDCLDKKPSQLSGGEKQRVAIARSLILKPKLLLLDESTSALDSDNQRQTLDLVKKYQKLNQTGVLFISHDLSSIGYLCDRIIVMKDGKIIEDQGKNLFFNNPQTSYSKSLINTMI